MARSGSDVLVLGAGAAGLMCAIEAGKRGRRVTVLERAEAIGKKILISGGGRCNFTNIHCGPENFLSFNPHFCKSALARYTPTDFVTLVEKHRVPYHEKKLGQLFCDRSARDITNLLAEECRAASVQTVTRCAISEVRRTPEYIVETSQGEFSAPALVVATGGLSIPKMGATSFGYELAHQFGLKIQPCCPALVPLTFSEQDRANYADLAGVSADVSASVNGVRFREKLLFTHRGLSGPAILQVSSYWKPSESIGIDLLPGSEPMPKRLAKRWLEVHDEGASPHDWEVLPKGTEGYEKAEVTAGGVDTAELSSKTMAARRVPGLYFIGEVVDVTGHLGGFNFQWAWASGYAAGQAV